MNNQSTAEMNPIIVTFLSVSPLVEDHFSLQAVFNHSKRVLYKADSLASALAIIRGREIGVVICERDLSPGTWIDMLEELRLLRNAPPLIVTSRLAGEERRAEALHRGATQPLGKPFR